MNIKRGNLICYAAYAGILMGFLALTVYPNFKKIRHVESEIESLKKKISEQRILHEQYKIYKAEIEKLDIINYFNFTVPIGNGKCNLSEIQEYIKNICEKYGFRFGKSRLDMRQSPDRVMLTCAITGEFEKLREVLIDFGRISCLEGIDQIRISPAENVPDTETDGNYSKKEIMISLRLFRSPS